LSPPIAYDYFDDDPTRRIHIVTSISGQIARARLEEPSRSESGAHSLGGVRDVTMRLAHLARARVLVVHDWIVAWGGAERTLEELLALFPQAELMVGVLGDGRRPLNAVTRRARETWLARVPLARRHHRWFLPLYPVAFATIDTAGYDLVVSSSHAFAKMVHTARGTPHVCYCHSPPRYLWDLHAAYRRDGAASGAALALAGPLLRAVDRSSAQRVTRFVANSHYIADRIRRCYDREAAVVYPPVSAKGPLHRRGPRSDALLSLGRLVPYKRVDLAIAAANELGVRLIVAGDGPERVRLERMAGPTVSFLGEVSEAKAGELMESCRAMVFSAEEDFGIAPVEANAHGLPVVALARGGVLESMLDGVSAEFFEDATVEALTDAICRAGARSWDEAAIRANARRFSAERFRVGMADEVARVLPPTHRAVASGVAAV
jgi:glycosyltransferase involved in cell wall biosynthesis